MSAVAIKNTLKQCSSLAHCVTYALALGLACPAPSFGDPSTSKSQTLAALFGVPDPATAGLQSHHKGMQERSIVFAVDVKLADLPVGVSTSSGVSFSGGAITKAPPNDAITCSILPMPAAGAKPGPRTSHSADTVAVLDHVKVIAVCWNVMPTSLAHVEPQIRLVLITEDRQVISCTNIKPSTTVNELTATFGTTNLNLDVTENSGVTWQAASKISAPSKRGMRDVPTAMEPSSPGSSDESALPPSAARLPEMRSRDRDSFIPSRVDESRK